jgi:adenine deaminase
VGVSICDGSVYGWSEHTSARRVVGDLVTHDLHNVVAVGDETE